jgi:hypothetical protein
LIEQKIKTDYHCEQIDFDGDLPMTRMSKQSKRRALSPRAPKLAGKKTGAKKDKLAQGFKAKTNAFEGELASYGFFPKF